MEFGNRSKPSERVSSTAKEPSFEERVDKARRHGMGWGWGLGILLVFAAIAPKNQSSGSGSDDAHRAAMGLYGRTVIACYQMNDYELMANESRCKDAMRRVNRGY